MKTLLDKTHSVEISTWSMLLVKAKKEITRSWNKKEEYPYYIVVKLSNFIAYNKAESRKCADEFVDLAKEVPKQSREDVAWFLFPTYSKIQKK